MIDTVRLKLAIWCAFQAPGSEGIWGLMSLGHTPCLSYSEQLLPLSGLFSLVLPGPQFQSCPLGMGFFPSCFRPLRAAASGRRPERLHGNSQLCGCNAASLDLNSQLETKLSCLFLQSADSCQLSLPLELWLNPAPCSGIMMLALPWVREINPSKNP